MSSKKPSESGYVSAPESIREKLKVKVESPYRLAGQRYIWVRVVRVG
jgi:hypothetical protein